jgi:hypothetical protein
MPVVRPEISCYPYDLLTNPPTEPPERRWMIAHTLARQEKSLARDLCSREIPFYLPLAERWLSYKARRVLSLIPLYSGFVFLFVNEQERLTCMSTRRIANLLSVADQAGLLQDLQRVAHVLSSGSSCPLGDDPLLVRLGLQARADARSEGRHNKPAVVCGSN